MKNEQKWKVKGRWPHWPRGRLVDDQLTGSLGLGILRASRVLFSTLFSSIIQGFLPILAWETDFGVFQTYSPNFEGDLRALKTSVSNFGPIYFFSMRHNQF